MREQTAYENPQYVGILDSRWPEIVMEHIMEHNILDFSEWEDDVKFEGMFRKLIDGLELFYKDKSHG